MKFVAKSLAVLTLLAVVMGAIGYNLLSSKVSKSGSKAGTITIAPQNLAKADRDVTNAVTRVEMNGPFDLAVVHGDKARLTLSGDERLLPKVVAQQDGNVLHIATTGMLVTNNQTVKITLVVPALEELTQLGSGDSEVQGFDGTTLKLNLYGSGDLDLKGRYQRLVLVSKGSGGVRLTVPASQQIEANVSGSGDVELIGKTDKFVGVLMGAASIDAERLIASTATGVMQGPGTMKIYASKQVDVTSTGRGNVEIYGNPGVKNVNNTGGGDVSFN